MASGTHHHHQHHHQQQQQQHQQQQHQQQQQQQHLMQHQSNQIQFAANPPAGLGSTNFDQQQQQQSHQHQHNTMSPNSTPMSINHSQGNIVTMSHHQHHQQQLMGTIVGSNMGPSANQTVNHIQQQHQHKSQILPLLLSPRPSSLTPTSNDHLEMSADDQDQIIDQVIGLENDYSDNTGMLGSVESGTGLMMNNQHNLGDMNLSGGISFLPDSNQFSSSSEDLLNLLLEFDREPSNLIGLGSNQQLDQDEKVGIENIRKQLMSCEMQSENHNTNSMSPVVNNQMTCQPQQQRVTQQEQQHPQARNQQQVTQLISQSAPVISHHQPHQLSSTGTSQQQQQQQQQQVTAEQSILHGSYSNVPMSTVPVSSSGQPYAPQQQHVTRISQSNPMSIVNSSPSPSWQQPQLSPYSPQPPHNNSRTPSQRQGHQQHHPIHHPQQQHSMQQHQSTTSPQMQQLHHSLQQRSPSQSLSPPATTEPSPVVKKNPLLNAQLVNTRAPSITPTRFMNNQANVLNQNPILNAKLSQGPFVNNSGNIVGSPVNPSLNSQSRYIQQTTQQSNFSYDIPPQQQQQQQQQQSAQQQTSQQSGQANMFGSDQQQQGNRIFRANATSGGGSSLSMGNTSPSGGLSQQVKQEIRRKVLPKQQHQTTSLLKQLLSDDNK